MMSDPTTQEFKTLSDFGKEELVKAAVKHAQELKLERLRDEFAMHAMEVFISKQTANSFGHYDHERAAKLAYLQANQMLIAREQSK